MPNNWSRGYPDLEKLFPDPNAPKPKKYIPSPAKIRQMAKDSKEGGRFTCPLCHESFSVTYSVFGTTKPFQEPCFHCRDCVKTNTNFRKAR
jgi:hypothetical protein